MKKFLSVIVVVAGVMIFASCSNKKEPDQSYEEFRSYVSERRDSTDRYFDKEWDEMEREYEVKRMEAESKMNDWNDETRAEYASLQSDWDQFREEYVSEKSRRDNITKNETMLRGLFPEGVTEDMSTVTAENLLTVHDNFVSFVDANRDELTREQWDRIEFLWEALGTRKNEVEKELKRADNLKIAELKIKYGSIKSTNRTQAKAEENEEAKATEDTAN